MVPKKNIPLKPVYTKLTVSSPATEKVLKK